MLLVVLQTILTNKFKQWRLDWKRIRSIRCWTLNWNWNEWANWTTSDLVSLSNFFVRATQMSKSLLLFTKLRTTTNNCPNKRKLKKTFDWGTTNQPTVTTVAEKTTVATGFRLKFATTTIYMTRNWDLQYSVSSFSSSTIIVEPEDYKSVVVVHKSGLSTMVRKFQLLIHILACSVYTKTLRIQFFNKQYHLSF